ncbi:hypothetical protein ABMA28_003470 [Loxostege sticticalis]|uniref:DDE Tnp4 domain-containing protein n=1 Tax=Loxostege sticticalis TaxID=481309 RepID=A0ABD0SYP8_LOXSC
MRMPTKEEWFEISQRFEINANFPNCLGAVDGKHIRIKPQQSGSMFLNYKYFFFIVLMAVVDFDYNFVFIDVGSYGKDCAVFKKTQFWKSLIDNTLNIPTPCDEAFALHTNLLRPYGGLRLWRRRVAWCAS